MAPDEQKVRRPWRFSRLSLRTAFIVLTIACAISAFQVNSATKQRRAVDAIEKDNGWVYYAYQYDSQGERISTPQFPAPTWLRNLIGDHYFTTVRHIKLREKQVHDLEMLKDLTSLRSLMCDTRAVANQGNVFAELKQLRVLSLYGSPLSAVGMENIKRLTQLDMIIVNGGAITPEDVEALRQALPHCQIDN